MLRGIGVEIYANWRVVAVCAQPVQGKEVAVGCDEGLVALHLIYKIKVVVAPKGKRK